MNTVLISAIAGVLLLSINGPSKARADGETRFRVDCRYHNVEKYPGVRFCYSSSLYEVNYESKSIGEIHFGIGCDNQTLYDDKGKYAPGETTLDRISPPRAATPAVEIKPQYALFQEGVYESTADILGLGRMDGRCYVTRRVNVSQP